MPTSKRIIVAVASAILALSCTGTPPGNPSPPLTPSPTPAPAPPPTPAPPTGPADVWNIVVRTTAIHGGGCVGQVMQSHLGEPKNYTLSVTPHTTYAVVNIRSAAGDIDCTFDGAQMTPDGFTTWGTKGYFSCRPGFESIIQCDDGVQHNLIAEGQDISGQISDDHIVGQWSADWGIDDSTEVVDIENAFTGSR